MKKLYTIFCLAICLFISGQSMAQINNIGGTITTDTTWMDTVNVTSDIYLPDSVTLTIQAGTVIDFDSACMISVDGSIMAIGSVNDSITFTADSTGFGTLSHYGWKGIDIDDPASGDSSIFAYCRFFYFNGEYGYACIHTYDFSEMIVENCRFSYNYNYQETTCIHIEYEGNSIIRNNLFTYNYSDRSCIQLGCGSGNEPNTTILNNTFMYNEGYDEGACLKISAYSNAKAINNVFRYNYCEGYGCAIDITGYATPTIIGNLISDNYSTYYGGGVSIKYYANPRLINNTIVNNYAEDGGGIQIGCYTTSPYFENNIIWGNEALYEGDQLYCYDDGTSGYTFINNIIQGGIDSIYFDEPPFGGVDINTINTSPMFVDSANGDYHLTCLSPAIDAGSNPTIMMPPVDLDGNQRLIGSNYDIGVYEMLAAAVILSHPQNTQVMTGTVANFTVNTNYSTAFQWEESTDFGSTWSALTDGATYSGVTTNNLSINAVYTMNGYMFRCQIEGNCPGFITPSNPAILIVDYNVGISENNNEIMVYPNPSKNNVFIQGAEGADITISDLNGRVIESRYDLGSDKEMISLTEYENGMYILRVIQDNNISIIKIIKE